MKKLKIGVLSLLLVFTSLYQTHAQMGMGKIEEIEAVQSRKIIVMIEEPREKMLKRIAKKPKRGSVDDYKADLKKYNESIKEVIEKFWPNNKREIQYKTFDEIEALKKSKSKEYAVVCCLSAEPSSSSAGLNFNDGLYWEKDVNEDFEDRDDLMFTMMVVNTIEDFGRTPVYQVPLFDVFPIKSDLVYGLQTMKNYFDMRIRVKKEGGKMKDEREMIKKGIAENAPKLKEKTLLVRSEWLDKELTEANFKDHYPYKYKICDRAMMDEIVMTQNKDYAYGVVLPYVVSGSRSNSIMYFQYVFDADGGKMMCLVQPSTGSMMGAGSFGGHAGNRNFTFKVMDKIHDQILGKK